MSQGEVILGATVDDRAFEFEAAVAPEANRLFGLALTITGDPGHAEDAVQETMFSAWRSWGSLRDRSKVHAWLTRICVNHCIHQRRFALRRFFWTSDEEMDRMSQKLPASGGGDLLDFQRVYRRLSPPQRAVFALHVHHGYTLDECAALMGCRPGTARSHLGRAMARLRKEMIDG
jgi:RNA polymerase sigma-70 factor (ECF subfamily)